MNKEIPMMEKRIPVYYVVTGGLIFSIIITSTSVLCGRPKAFEYISFASTITSLVLGVIAIFYSIISNSESSKNIGALAEASQKVKDGSEKIFGISASIDDSVKTLMEITGKLNLHLDQVPQHFEEMKGEINTLSEKFNYNFFSPSSEAKSTLELNEVSIKSFLKNSTVGGLYAIYAAEVAYENEVELSISSIVIDFEDDIGSIITMYFIAYLNACKALDIIRFSGETRIVKLSFVNTTIKGLVKQYLIEKINKM
ncbi:MAG: hypothetical protein JWO03_1812, partial [Bacteroidetes bacterium]|nr:hypothetical protein [Bacteroidota bacterium]